MDHLSESNSETLLRFTDRLGHLLPTTPTTPDFQLAADYENPFLGKPSQSVDVLLKKKKPKKATKKKVDRKGQRKNSNSRQSLIGGVFSVPSVNVATEICSLCYSSFEEELRYCSRCSQKYCFHCSLESLFKNPCLGNAANRHCFAAKPSSKKGSSDSLYSSPFTFPSSSSVDSTSLLAKSSPRQQGESSLSPPLSPRSFYPRQWTTSPTPHQQVSSQSPTHHQVSSPSPTHQQASSPSPTRQVSSQSPTRQIPSHQLHRSPPIHQQLGGSPPPKSKKLLEESVSKDTTGASFGSWLLQLLRSGNFNEQKEEVFSFLFNYTRFTTPLELFELLEHLSKTSGNHLIQRNIFLLLEFWVAGHFSETSDHPLSSKIENLIFTLERLVEAEKLRTTSRASSCPKLFEEQSSIQMIPPRRVTPPPNQTAAIESNLSPSGLKIRRRKKTMSPQNKFNLIEESQARESRVVSHSAIFKSPPSKPKSLFKMRHMSPRPAPKDTISHSPFRSMESPFDDKIHSIPPSSQKNSPLPPKKGSTYFSSFDESPSLPTSSRQTRPSFFSRPSPNKPECGSSISPDCAISPTSPSSFSPISPFFPASPLSHASSFSPSMSPLGSISQFSPSSDEGTKRKRSKSLKELSSGFVLIQLEYKKLGLILTRYLAQMYDAIPMSELRMCSWMKPDKQEKAQNIVQLSKLFDSISRWASHELIASVATPDFRRTHSFLTKTASEMRKLNNYFGAFAIILGMDHPSVTRLKKLYGKHVSERSQTRFDSLLALADPADNFVAYRNSIQSLSPEAYAIPYFPFYLKSLAHLEEAPDFDLLGANQSPPSSPLYSDQNSGVLNPQSNTSSVEANPLKQSFFSQLRGLTESKQKTGKTVKKRVEMVNLSKMDSVFKVADELLSFKEARWDEALASSRLKSVWLEVSMLKREILIERNQEHLYQLSETLIPQKKV